MRTKPEVASGCVIPRLRGTLRIELWTYIYNISYRVARLDNKRCHSIDFYSNMTDIQKMK